MDEKIHRVVCPMLKEAGVPEDNSGKGIALCLFCPYEDCIYDKVNGRTEAKNKRWAEIRRLAKERKSQKEIMSITGLSRDTVRLALLKEKDEY